MTGGYLCTPYLHDHNSVNLKNSWLNLPNMKNIYFATATFPKEIHSYYPNLSNHYLLAKFYDYNKTLELMKQHIQSDTSFIFNIDDNLFERNVDGTMNFVTVYYLEYNESNDDLNQIAQTIIKRDHISNASLGSMSTFCSEPLKFNFPYADNLLMLEVSSTRGHQSVNKYCDEMRRYINRKGMTITNVVSLSILEQWK